MAKDKQEDEFMYAVRLLLTHLQCSDSGIVYVFSGCDGELFLGKSMKEAMEVDTPGGMLSGVWLLTEDRMLLVIDMKGVHLYGCQEDSSSTTTQTDSPPPSPVAETIRRNVEEAVRRHTGDRQNGQSSG